ncbi:hypothetical protein MASRES_GEN13592_19190 [Acinetobacter baumannii]
MGLQYLEQDNSALSPVHSQEGHTTYLDNQQLLNRNVTKNFSVFGLEKYNWNDFTFELGARIEKQKVSMGLLYKKLKIQRKLGLINITVLFWKKKKKNFKIL